MKTGRFFGTAVLVLFTVLVVSCKANHHDSKRGHIRNSKAFASNNPVQEGGEMMGKAMQIGAELGLRYQMHIQSHEARDHMGQKVNNNTLSQDYNWRRFTLSERNQVKGKLNQYVGLLSEILALDAKKGIYLTMKETVIGWRDGAIAYQRSLEHFEKTFGESYEPKTGSQLQPIYNRSLEASAEVR